LPGTSAHGVTSEVFTPLSCEIEALASSARLQRVAGDFADASVSGSTLLFEVSSLPDIPCELPGFGSCTTGEPFPLGKQLETFLGKISTDTLRVAPRLTIQSVSQCLHLLISSLNPSQRRNI
jgi:hypothetical protein